MPAQGQPGLPASGKGSLWLCMTTILLMATPAFSGCPFRHGLRFAAPAVHAHAAPSVAVAPDAPAVSTMVAASTAASPSSYGHTAATSRRLQGLVGLGVTTGLDQPLARDTRTTMSRAYNQPRATNNTTPYPSTPYGTTDKPTNPVAKDWVSVVSACKVRQPPTMRLRGGCMASG
jgi:hypothetical protein